VVAVRGAPDTTGERPPEPRVVPSYAIEAGVGGMLGLVPLRGLRRRPRTHEWKGSR
jgi:hypothetical protein